LAAYRAERLVNCVVVTKRENQSLAHVSNWLDKFSPYIVTLMQVHEKLDKFEETESRGR